MLANVLCEVVLVFTCMFHHADYYRIIIIAYDYESSQPHASFYVYICMYEEWVYYLLNTSANVFCQYCPRREGLRRWSSAEEHLPSFLAVAHHHIGQEEDN